MLKISIIYTRIHGVLESIHLMIQNPASPNCTLANVSDMIYRDNSQVMSIGSIVTVPVSRVRVVCNLYTELVPHQPKSMKTLIRYVSLIIWTF